MMDRADRSQRSPASWSMFNCTLLCDKKSKQNQNFYHFLMFVFRIRQKNPPRYQRIPERRKSSGTGDGYVTTAASGNRRRRVLCLGREKSRPRMRALGGRKVPEPQKAMRAPRPSEPAI